MAQMIFNKRLIQGIVFLAHVMIVGLFAFFVFQISALEIHNISSIHPVQAGYDVLNLGWIGWGRDIGHFICAICATLIGTRLVLYGMSRQSEVAKFFSVAIGVQVLFSAALNIVLVGLVWFGGWWHLLSMVVVGMEACSLVVTSTIMLLYWGSLMNVGRRDDDRISYLKSVGRVNDAEETIV